MSLPSLFSDAMVWKHVVQIESIDASGFLLWTNGLTRYIIELSVQSAAFGIQEKLNFAVRL